MKKPKFNIDDIDEIDDIEEVVISGDLEISVGVDEDENVIYVKFSGFSETDSIEDYALFLADVLPLLITGDSPTIH